MSKPDISILIIEDTGYTSGTFQEKLTNPSITLELVASPVAARHSISEKNHDIYLVDLKLDPKEKQHYHGIDLIGFIHKKDRNALIIAYTNETKSRQNKDIDLEKSCINAGADYFKSTVSLTTQDSNKLIEYLYQLRDEKLKTIREKFSFKTEEDNRTKAFLEIIQEETLIRIVDKFSPEMADYKVRAIQSGFSGASLIELMCKSQKHIREYDVIKIIKLAKQLNILEEELRRKPSLGSYYHNISKLPNDKIEKIDSWWCFELPKIQDLIELSKYLLSDDKKDHQLKDVFDNFVDIGLVNPAKKDFPNHQTTIAAEFNLSYYFGSQLIEILDEILKYDKLLNNNDLSKVANILYIIRAMLDNKLDLLSSNSRLAFLHGDFHCNNIFVAQNKDPLIIDFGRSSILPRLFDFANLNVDLIVQRFDYLGGKFHDLALIDDWTDLLLKQYPYSNLGEFDHKNDNVLYLIKILQESMVTQLDNVSKREYAEVLVFNFLRYLRFPTVPIPKKVLIIRLLTPLMEILQN